MLEEYDPDEWLRDGDIALEADYVWHPNKTPRPAVAVFVGEDSPPLVIFVNEVEDFISFFSSTLRRFAKNAEDLASRAVYEDEFDV